MHGQPPVLMLGFEGVASTLLLAEGFCVGSERAAPAELVVGVPARPVPASAPAPAVESGPALTDARQAAAATEREEQARIGFLRATEDPQSALTALSGPPRQDRELALGEAQRSRRLGPVAVTAFVLIAVLFVVIIGLSLAAHDVPLVVLGFFQLATTGVLAVYHVVVYRRAGAYLDRFGPPQAG